MTVSPVPATKADVQAHFEQHGTGDITEIKLMSGFGFIEYKDAMDARDVVPGEADRFGKTDPINYGHELANQDIHSLSCALWNNSFPYASLSPLSNPLTFTDR